MEEPPLSDEAALYFQAPDLGQAVTILVNELLQIT